MPLFTLDHFVLNVLNVDQMVTFYTESLGLPGERIDDYYRGECPFPSVRINEHSMIDLFPPALWQKDSARQTCRPNMNHFCLATTKERWLQLQQRLTEEGYPLKDGPGERWGAHGTGCSIYFDDPEGNYFEIRYYDKAVNGIG